MKNHYLEEILDMLNEVSRDIENSFSSLTEEQLNWKPSANVWSVGQCIDHLVVTNSQYFSILEPEVRGQKVKNRWEKLGLLSGFFGKMILKSVTPGSSKIKTAKVFEPAKSNIPSDIIEKFNQIQLVLITYIKQLDHLDHKKYIISSPVKNWITYNLKDVFTIISVHERRHYLQAKNIMDHEQFPKSLSQ